MMTLVDMLFGCWHKNYSFPITAKGRSASEAARVTGTYVVCLDCGREFPYDWKSMRVVGYDFEREEEVVATVPEPLRQRAA